MGRAAALSLVRVRVAIVDAPRGASGLRAHVAAFKRLLKPDVCGRLGVVSCERVADLLDLHDEGGLASWVRSRLAATRPVTGRSSTGRHRVVGPGRTPADSSCLAWCRSFGTSARPRSPRQALTQPKAKASGTSRSTPIRRFAGLFERVCAMTGSLKIVVSPVRVRVSPSQEIPANPMFLSQGWASEMSGYAPRKCAKSQTKCQRPTARRSVARPGHRWCGASIDRPVRARISTSVIRGSVGSVNVNAAHRLGARAGPP
jgi:hypothetical protein